MVWLLLVVRRYFVVILGHVTGSSGSLAEDDAPGAGQGDDEDEDDEDD